MCGECGLREHLDLPREHAVGNEIMTARGLRRVWGLPRRQDTVKVVSSSVAAGSQLLATVGWG